MKKYLLAGLIGAVGLAGAAMSGPLSAAEIVLKAGHSQNAGQPMDKGLHMIAEYVKEATNGRVEIQIFPNMQLGGEIEMIKQVLTGTLDITSPSNAPLTNFVPELKIFDMPFLFRDEAHMIKVLRGPVLQDINKIVSKRGIRLLGVYNVGVRHLMTKKLVTSIADLKGLKIRTMQSKYHMAAFNA
ncbi:MAG: TRAP transporter substrate-binding protein, partial [Alphaproteobacteria bacterium]